MGIVDDDGRPIRGAGALPWAGGSGGVGDMSGVAFARNIMEHPPSQQRKRDFVADFNKMIADIRTGAAPPLESNEQTGPAGPRNQPVLNDEQKREEIRLKRVAQANRMREAKIRKQEERRNGGSVAMPESTLPKRGKRTQAKSVAVQGNDQGYGVSQNGLPHLPRPGSDSGSGISEAEPQRQIPAQGVQPQLVPIPENVQQQLREAVLIAAQPFHVDASKFMQMPLDQAEHMVNELRAQVAALSNAVEARRQEEATDRSDVCTWCQKPFPNGAFFARFPFELEVGSGQWRAIYSCRTAECLARFNQAVDKIQEQLKAERGM